MKNRIDDIEILRAFAVILVIIEHMKINLFTWGSPFLSGFYGHFGGWTGVDLFFVLSGSLIPAGLLAEFETSGSIDIRAFWVRRARRG